MTALQATSGKVFYMMWLHMLTERHTPALSIWHGSSRRRVSQFQPAKDLAAMITRTQTAEVDQMRRLLASA